MTDDTPMRAKARAVFLAALMVVSVFGGTMALAGSAAAAGVTTVDVGNEPLVQSSSSQDIGELNVTVNAGSSGTAAIAIPGDTSFNQAESDLAVRQVDSGSSSAQISNVRFENGEIKFDYSGFGGTNDSIIFGDISVDVADSAEGSFDLDVRVGAASTTRTINTTTPSVNGGNGSVGAGVSGQTLTNLNVSTTGADGQLANGSSIVVEAPTDNGITFSDSQSLSVAAGNSSKVDVENATVSADTLTIPVTADFSAGDYVNVSGIAVDVAGDATSGGALTVTTEPVDSLGTHSADGDTISVAKPTLDYANATFAVGKDSQQLGNGNVTVNATGDEQMTSGTNVTLTFDNADVTVDQSAGIGAEVNGGNGSVNETYVTTDSITVEVNESLNSTAQLNFTNVAFNVSADATEGATFALTAATGENGSVTVSEDNGANVELQKPELVYSGDTIKVDNDGVEDVSLRDIIVQVDADGNIQKGTNVTVTLPQDAGITFNNSTTPNAFGKSGGTENVALLTNNTTSTNNNNATHLAAIRANGDSVGSSLNGFNVDYNVGASGTDASNVGQENIKRVGIDTDNDGTIETDVSNSLSSVSASNGGSTLELGFDGSYNIQDGDIILVEFSDVDQTGTGGGDVDIVVNPQSAGETETATLTIDGSDTNEISGFSGLGLVVADTPVVNNHNITFNVTSTVSNGTEIVVDRVSVDVADGASNATLSAETDTGDNVITVVSQNQIVVEAATPSQITADADNSGTFGDTAADGPQIGETIEGAVKVNDSAGNAFGGADVTFTVTDSPNGSSGASVTSSATTNSSGIATFNFTGGDTIGEYDVQAQTSSGATVNVTYTVTAGEAAQLNVTQVKDAVTGDGSTDQTQAIFKVQVEDAGGNLNTSTSVDVTTVLSGDSQYADAYYDYNVSDGTHSSTFGDDDGDGRINYNVSNDSIGNGTFFVAVSNTAAEDVTASIDPEGSITEDSATASVYRVDGVAVSLNKSTSVAGEDVEVTAVPQDGDVDVTVPRLSVIFDSTNTTVASVTGTPNPDTDVDGVANTTLSADQAGSSMITATTRNKQGSTTLNVVSQEAGASETTLTADPVFTGETATHTLEAIVGENSAGSSLTGVTVDYSVSNSSADASNVGQSDVTSVGIDTSGDGVIDTNVSDDLDSVGASNNGETLTFDFGGSYSLEQGDTVLIGYDNVTNPSEAGDFNVTVQVNPQSDPVDESNATLTIEEPDAASFDVSELSAPANATIGDTVNVSAVVTNTGDLEATQEVEFRFNGSTVATQNVTLAGGAEETVMFELNTSGVAAGTYTHGVYTADTNQTANITIEEAPDEAFFDVSELSAPANATAGDTIEVSAVVTNTGDLEATQEVEFRLAGDTLATQNVTLAGGANETVMFEIDTSGVDAGTYTHGVYTADANQTAEITIEAPTANLMVESVEGPENVTAGENLTVSAVVANNGSAEGTDTVEVTLDVNGNGVYGDDGDVTVSEEVTVAAGANTTVDLTLSTDNVPAGTYTYTAFVGDSSASQNVTIEEAPDEAFFDVSELSAPANATVGDTIEVSAVVTNTGDLEATQEVEFRLAGDTLATQNVTLAGGANETVMFEVNTSGVAAGTYTHGVYTADANQTAEITIEEAAGEEPPVVVGDSPATDPDGDGQFEDVNGNGALDIGDVQALFANQDSDAVQNNIDMFDFNNNGGIDIGDVQALFTAYQDSQ